MCGIVGIVTSPENRFDLNNIINDMADQIIHRGPDYRGIFLDNNLTFCQAHQRLSIMDLSKAVSKVDRKHSKTISGLWRYVEGPMKKFKELISKEVLDKLQ